jgi:hypothetical protein
MEDSGKNCASPDVNNPKKGVSENSPAKALSLSKNAFQVNRSLIFGNNPFGLPEEKNGIIRPKPMHASSLTPKAVEQKEESLIQAQMKEESINPLLDRQADTKDSDDYTYIDSIYPDGGKIRVTNLHLKRILKRRQERMKDTKEEAPMPVPRPRHDGPMHDSRSKFAKKRPRDPNGRFYTKAELEEIRKQNYVDAVIQYLREHRIPNVSDK